MFFLPIAVLLFVLIILEFYFVFQITPQPNDECLWIPKIIYKDSVGFFFDEVKENGVTWNAGIRDGDQFIAINDEPVTDLQIANQILNSLSSGDSVAYTVKRGGELITTNVEVKKLLQFGGLAFALIAGIWLVIGFWIYSVKPDGLSQILFYRIGAALTLFSAFNILLTENILNPIYDYPVVVIILDYLWTLGGAFLPFLIIHFFWVFPKPFSFAEKKITKKILYITPLVLFVLSILMRIFLVYLGEFNSSAFYYYYPSFNLSAIFVGTLIGLVSLFINYTRLKTKRERDSIFIILIAYGIAVAAIAYTFMLSFTGNYALKYNSPEFFMPIILIALLPVSFGYSIFKYSLLDVSDVVKNTVLYGAATVFIAAVYFFIIYFVGQYIGQAISTEYQGLIAGVIFILFAIIFQSTKDNFQQLITKKFYPEQFAYQKVILKFSSDVPSIVGLENILSSTKSTFVESLQVQNFGIAIRNKHNNKFFDVAEGVGFKEFPFSLKIDFAKLAEHILSRKDSALPVVIEENNFEAIFPDDSEQLKNENIHTIIPLVINSKIIGMLLFGLKHSGSKFIGGDLELLTVAANQVAVAIENARLYESEKDKVKLELELENARRIQNSLLPKSIPYIKGLGLAGTMIPAMQVGGDYYDLIKVSDSKIFVIVGDVSGKGLSASFYMSKLQTMMQLYCSDNKTPREVLIEINRKIYGFIERNWFITISIALFDIEKRNILFCRAGHTPLVLCRNGIISEIKPAGIGVGLEAGDIFERTIEQIELPILKDDLFALYSDGVNETMNTKSELFGEERLYQAIKNFCHEDASNILKRVLDSLNEFRNTAEQSDDITLVMARLNS